VVLVLHLSRNPGFDSRGQYPEIKIFPDFITNDQHKSIIGALRAAALNWEYGRLTLWWVTTDGLLKATFYTKLKKLHVKEGKKDKLFADHVTQVCEVHHRAILFFYQQVQGFARPITQGSTENTGHNVHV